MDNMQEEIDKKNKETKEAILHAKKIAERNARRERVKSVVMGPVEYFKKRLEAKEEARAEKEKAQQYQDACQKEYSLYLERAEKYNSNG